MIYLDSAATSFHKPRSVHRAVAQAMATCASPGRGGYDAAARADRLVYRCRETGARLFDCQPEQVVFTTSCTHGLNIAIRTLIRPGDRVVISGFEHNAVVRPLQALGARVTVAGRRIFDWEDTLTAFTRALDQGAEAAVFTHVSNVFGYILPVGAMAKACRDRGIPFILDAAQSAGSLRLSMEDLGAEFIAMPGHKGLLGPQGTGLLLCREEAEPLLYGGTGSQSRSPEMPLWLPDRLEAGTMNVPGIAGLEAGLNTVLSLGPETIGHRERQWMQTAAAILRRRGMEVFTGRHQAGVLSFRCAMDCQEAARILGEEGIALRAGLHCAPLAHESAGTLESGTLRLSFGFRQSGAWQRCLAQALTKLPGVTEAERIRNLRR